MKYTPEKTTHEVSFLNIYSETEFMIDDWPVFFEEEFESAVVATYDNTYDALYWFVVD